MGTVVQKSHEYDNGNTGRNTPVLQSNSIGQFGAYNSYDKPTNGATPAPFSISVFVMPDWIHRYLITKGCVGQNFFNEYVIDQRVCIEDLAALFYLNSDFKVNGGLRNIELSTPDFSMKLREFSNIQSDETRNKIQTALSWMYTEGVDKDLKARLTDNNFVYNETSPPYEFVVLGPEIWLILKSGFMNLLQNPIHRLQFYRDYLTTIGKALPFNSVSRTDIFRQYVKDIVG